MSTAEGNLEQADDRTQALANTVACLWQAGHIDSNVLHELVSGYRPDPQLHPVRPKGSGAVKTQCIICSEPIGDSTVVGEIGYRTGPLCKHCAHVCDGNITEEVDMTTTMHPEEFLRAIGPEERQEDPKEVAWESLEARREAEWAFHTQDCCTD